MSLSALAPERPLEVLDVVAREMWIAETTDHLVRQTGNHIDVTVCRSAVYWALRWRDRFTDLFRDRDDLTIEVMHRLLTMAMHRSLADCDDIPSYPYNGGLVSAHPYTWLAVLALRHSYGDGVDLLDKFLNYRPS